MKTNPSGMPEMPEIFSLKCLKHPQLKRLSPRNENPHSMRNKVEFLLLTLDAEQAKTTRRNCVIFDCIEIVLSVREAPF